MVKIFSYFCIFGWLFVILSLCFYIDKLTGRTKKTSFAWEMLMIDKPTTFILLLVLFLFSYVMSHYFFLELFDIQTSIEEKPKGTYSYYVRLALDDYYYYGDELEEINFDEGLYPAEVIKDEYGYGVGRVFDDDFDLLVRLYSVYENDAYDDIEAEGNDGNHYKVRITDSHVKNPKVRETSSINWKNGLHALLYISVILTEICKGINYLGKKDD